MIWNSNEEELELISFRKTNTSVEENMGDLDNGDYILIENKHQKGIQILKYNLFNNEKLLVHKIFAEHTPSIT